MAYKYDNYGAISAIRFTKQTEWIPEAIENALRHFEAQGINMSKAEFVRTAIAHFLDDLHVGEQLDEEFMEDFKDMLPRRSQRRYDSPQVRNIKFSLSNLWILNYIMNLVEVRNQLGVGKTSLTTEIMRLLTQAIDNSTKGIDLDQKLMSDYKIEKEEEQS